MFPEGFENALLLSPDPDSCPTPPESAAFSSVAGSWIEIFVKSFYHCPRQNLRIGEVIRRAVFAQPS